MALGVGEGRWENCQSNRKAGLKCILRTNIADLGDVGFNELEAMALN